MRLILPLLLAACTPPVADTAEPPVTDSGEPRDSVADTGALLDTAETGWEDGELPPPSIDQAAPAHVELATFALG